MKRILILTLVLIFVVQFGSQAQSQTEIIFPKGKLTAANFTGNV